MIHKSHFGVYALILNEPSTHLLTIKKARGPYTGRYDLPGGSMEDGEILEDTLCREVMEETGCTVTNHLQMGTLSTLFKHVDTDGVPVTFRHIGVIYQCTISGTPMTDGDGQDSHGCHWLPISEVKKLTNVSAMLSEACAHLISNPGQARAQARTI